MMFKLKYNIWLLYEKDSFYLIWIIHSNLPQLSHHNMLFESVMSRVQSSGLQIYEPKLLDDVSQP